MRRVRRRVAVEPCGGGVAGALALSCIALVLSATPVEGQEMASGPPVAAVPVPDPSDVASIDAIISASYDVISGPAGDRDWDRERSLFHPDSRHMPTQRNGLGGSNVHVQDVEGFIQAAGEFFAQSAFYEYEIARETQRFGDIAHVFSTYAWGTEPDGPVLGRGINSFQLLYDGTRWWIVSVYWAQESDEMRIPAEYLPEAD